MESVQQAGLVERLAQQRADACAGEARQRLDVIGIRQQQRQRDHKRRVSQLVKNTLVVDLKRSAAEVWLVGRLAEELVKNTLVSSKLLILQAPSTPIPAEAAS